MSKYVLTVLVAAALALTPAAALAKPAAHADLWATVNLCDTPAKPGAVGVRVSIPRERGAPQQWARIRLQWFDGNKRAWRLVRSSGGDAGWARFGIGTRLVQGGTTFTFPLPEARRAHRAARHRRRGVARRHQGRRSRAHDHDRGAPRQPGPSAARVALVVRDHAVANSRGSLVMIPVTPSASSLAMRVASSTVHT